MNQGLTIIIPLVFFFVLDIVVYARARRNSAKIDTGNTFKMFGIAVIVQQGLIAFNYACDYGYILIPIEFKTFFNIIALISMTFVSYYWFKYYIILITGKNISNVLYRLLSIIPIVIISATTIVSPWTHWIIYMAADGVKYGSFFLLQVVCPYLYVIMAIIVTVVYVGRHGRAANYKILRQFLLFALPSAVGAIIQLLVQRGGYTQIGISFALILLYLEQYMEEVNEVNRILEKQAILEEEKERIQNYNKELEETKRDLERAKEQAEEASRAKTIFLNNMSHDIRTPMNAIVGFAELMEMEKDNPEKVTEYLEKIKNSSDYLLTIINNVLDMARIESGKAEIDESFLDLYMEEDITMSVFNELLVKKNLYCNMSMDIKHRYVFVDDTKTKQIAVNLISNAIKYTPEGGSISVNLKELPCDKEGCATYLWSVRDTGIGMSKEFCEHIFDAFSRERNTTESKILGTGLGMSIVKKLVDLLGGTIKVESELGKGTKISVILTYRLVPNPEEYIEEQRKDYIISEGLDISGKRILLAEDNDLNAEIAITIMESKGILIERAKDGVECIDMTSRSVAGYYDLILMDIQMPNIDGYTAAQKIRRMEDEVKSNIPIIAMTANAFEEDKKKALDYGMNGHVSKPINIVELIKTITDVLKQ